jgi:beta-lactamase superfamily II metal-dependent hydrolase
MRRVFFVLFAVVTLAAVRPTAQATPKPLDIYYIDTEGGQSTLFVAPSGQTVLVDTGNTGTRDPQRIMEAVKAAGVKQIDYLVVTHYHGDHIGGYPELSKMIPIAHIVDHGPTVQPEQKHEVYDAAVAKGPHIVPKPGDKLPITGLDWTFVSVAGKTIKTDMKGAPGAGRPNPYCSDFKPKDIQVDLENGQSTGSVIAYGKFRTVDLGDLLWNVEGELMCPTNHIGTVDLYLTTHHGLDWSNSKVVIHAIQPRVAIMNNGTRKGGQLETYATLETSPGLEDLWQLHWSYNGLLEHNVPAKFIANIDDNAQIAAVIADPPAPATQPLGPPVARGGPPAARGSAQGANYPKGPQGDSNHSTAYWIKVSAYPDGTFTVTNSRNGFSKTYKART